jgi:signal transduction histidine kinase
MLEIPVELGPRSYTVSVGQTIFSVTLTAQAARLLLDREPARVPELLDRLESMTASALAQLRSLIAKLHPSQTS